MVADCLWSCLTVCVCLHRSPSLSLPFSLASNRTLHTHVETDGGNAGGDDAVNALLYGRRCNQAQPGQTERGRQLKWTTTTAAATTTRRRRRRGGGGRRMEAISLLCCLLLLLLAVVVAVVVWKGGKEWMDGAAEKLTPIVEYRLTTQIVARIGRRSRTKDFWLKGNKLKERIS